MSVDERIRSAFGETDETWDARDRGGAARGRPAARARPRPPRGGAAVGSLAAAVAVGAVLVGTDRLGSESAPDPIGPPTPPSQAEPSGPNRSALEGRWRTAPLDEDDLRAALEGSGNGQYADQVLPALRPVPFRLVWLVTFETAELRLVSADGSEVLDKIELAVDGEPGDRVPAVRRRRHGPRLRRRPATSSGCRSCRRPRACRTACPARCGSGCSTTPSAFTRR